MLGNVRSEEGYFTVVVLRNPVKALLLNNEHQTTLPTLLPVLILQPQ